MLLHPIVALADQQLPDVIDFMRYSAGRVNGEITLNSDMLVNQTPSTFGNVKTTIRGDRKILFGFNNHAIRISSKNGIQLTIAGIKVDITDLGYDDKTKKFSVSTKVLGIISSKTIEAKIIAVLEKNFKSKLHEATKLLQRVRDQKSVGDAQEVLMSIVNIFKNGTGGNKVMPDFRGAVTLESIVPSTQTVAVRLAQADLKKGHTIYSTMDFRRSKGKLQMDAFRFYAPQGIKVRSISNDNKKSIKSATIRGVSLTTVSGLQIDGENGGDSLLSTAVTLVSVIGKAASMRPISEKDCLDVRLVQEMLDSNWKGNLKEYILANKARLLSSGYSPQLLNALIHTPPSGGINLMEFQPVDNRWLN